MVVMRRCLRILAAGIAKPANGHTLSYDIWRAKAQSWMVLLFDCWVSLESSLQNLLNQSFVQAAMLWTLHFSSWSLGYSLPRRTHASFKACPIIFSLFPKWSNWLLFLTKLDTRTHSSANPEHSTVLLNSMLMSLRHPSWWSVQKFSDCVLDCG